MDWNKDIKFTHLWQWTVFLAVPVAVNHLASVTTGWTQGAVFGGLAGLVSAAAAAYKVKSNRAGITPFSLDKDTQTWDACRVSVPGAVPYLKFLGPVIIPSRWFTPIDHYFLPWKKSVAKIDPVTGGISYGGKPITVVGKNDTHCDPVYSNETITGEAARYLMGLWDILESAMKEGLELNHDQLVYLDVFSTIDRYSIEIIEPGYQPIPFKDSIEHLESDLDKQIRIVKVEAALKKLNEKVDTDLKDTTVSWNRVASIISSNTVALKNLPKCQCKDTDKRTTKDIEEEIQEGR